MIVRLFSLPLPGLSVVYQQTLIPTVIALMFRAFPVNYWVISAGYQGIEQSVMDSGRLDFKRLSRMFWVDLPLLAHPMLFAALASAVVSSGDVPASLPVLPPGVVTVGTRLFALLHSGARNQEAALAFWYVAMIVLATIIMSVCWKGPRR